MPDWKMGILEKKRRVKEVELLLKEEEVLKLKQTPEWKRDLIKRTRSSQKVPIFKMFAPPLPPSPPPRSPPPAPQQEYPPLPPWIREKLSQVANQSKQEHKPQQIITSAPDTTEHSIPLVVQDIVHKFSNIPPPLPSPSQVSAQNFAQLTDSGSEHNLIDDPSLASLPDWKRSIIVRRRRGQVLKRLSLTKDDLDMISTLQKNPAKSTPDSVDIQLQSISVKRELKDARTALDIAEKAVQPSVNSLPVSSQAQLVTPADKRVQTSAQKRLFVTQEPQMKVKELRDKFAPFPQSTHSLILSPSLPKSMKIAKREFARPPPPVPQVPRAIAPIRASPDIQIPLPLSPEQILTVEEYNRHHALLVKAIASQISPSMVNGNEGMFNFIIPEALPSKRARTLSPDTPISSVDYKRVTDISMPLYTPPVPTRDYSPSASDSQTAELPLEEVTVSYIDEVSDEAIVPIHRPKSEQETSVPWRDTLEKIKTKRKERETAEIYENIVVISSHEAPVLKSSIKAPGERSKRGRVYFSESNPSVYQYPKMEIAEDEFGISNMKSFIANQEDLSHRIHPSIFASRQTHQSDKLQNYTPAILDYFDSIASGPAQPAWLQGEEPEEQSPSRDESEDIIDSFTAVPVDFEEELDMSNLSDRAAAMIW